MNNPNLAPLSPALLAAAFTVRDLPKPKPVTPAQLVATWWAEDIEIRYRRLEGWMDVGEFLRQQEIKHGK